MTNAGRSAPDTPPGVIRRGGTPRRFSHAPCGILPSVSDPATTLDAVEPAGGAFGAIDRDWDEARAAAERLAEERR